MQKLADGRAQVTDRTFLIDAEHPVGHRYRNVRENEGHTTDSSIVNCDNTTAHSWSNYGYEDPIAMQSTYGTNPPPIVPSTMDHLDFPFGSGLSRAVVSGNSGF